MDETIEIRHLNVKFHTEHGDVPAVKDVSLILRYGIITGLIGETGSGKSVLASAILRMLPDYAEASGSIWYRGNELLEATAKMMRRIRRTQIGLIPQSPGESLNPSRRVIAQAAECFDGTRAEKTETVLQALRNQGFQSPGEVARAYPFQLSGGMKQRVISLFGMRKGLQWIIADEPTKGLDRVVYRQVYESLRNLSEKEGCGMVVITHDLTLAVKLCDELAVMYEGEIVEHGKAEEVLRFPLHPYTKGLLASLPENGMHAMPAKPTEPAARGCLFAVRCPQCKDQCRKSHPELEEVIAGRKVRCLQYDRT